MAVIGRRNVHIHVRQRREQTFDIRIDNEGIHEYELSKPLKKIIAKDLKFEKNVKHAIEWLKEMGDY